MQDMPSWLMEVVGFILGLHRKEQNGDENSCWKAVFPEQMQTFQPAVGNSGCRGDFLLGPDSHRSERRKRPMELSAPAFCQLLPDLPIILGCAYLLGVCF